LAGLADDDRPRADQEDLPDVGAPRHVTSRQAPRARAVAFWPVPTSGATYSSTRPYTIDVSGVASSRRYSTSSSRPGPSQVTSPLPHSFSLSTLIRRSTRSFTARASSDSSLSVVNTAHSGFCPDSSVLR